MKSLKTKKLIILGIILMLVTNAILLFYFFRIAERQEIPELSSLSSLPTPAKSNEQLHAYQKLEDKNNYIQSQMAACAASRGANSCYAKVADELRAAFSITEALDLIATNETSPEVYARCHEVTHYLGRNAYKASQNLPSAIVSCDSTCQGGCYHGVVEEYLKEHDNNLSGEAIKKTFTSICDAKSLSPLVFAECEHGLGHAAMFVTDDNLTSSLTLCDSLAGLSNREHCYSGVFMEYSSSSTESDVSDKNMHPNDILYPCNTLSAQYLKLCYEYQSSYFSIITNYDAGKTAQLCLQVPKDYQEGCIQIIGGGQVGLTRDIKVMNHNCTQMPTVNYRQICNSGVISSLATRYVGQINKLADYCSLVAKEDQQKCFNHIGDVVVLWDSKSDARKLYCSQLKRVFKEWCFNSFEEYRTSLFN